MANLKTHFLGLKLKNPVIAGSSGLTNSVDNVKKLEDLGAGAVILKSIFEEQILHETRQDMEVSFAGSHPEAMDYLERLTMEHSISKYLDLIEAAKEALDIPVIANVNCLTGGEWVSYAQKIEAAGADALELNVLNTDYFEMDSVAIERNYFDIIEAVSRQISIPVSMKIGTLFTNLPKMIIALGNNTNLSGLTLFNRYWSPDIDVDKGQVVSANPFSAPGEVTIPLRWIGMVSDQVQCDLAASTGVYDGKSVVKLILAGATVVQVCSALYKNGLEHIKPIISELESWMDHNGHENVEVFRGQFASKTADERQVFGRAQFMKRYAGTE